VIPLAAAKDSQRRHDKKTDFEGQLCRRAYKNWLKITIGIKGNLIRNIISFLPAKFQDAA
jgi:hypothetical protein